jgi:hypothetical protein
MLKKGPALEQSLGPQIADLLSGKSAEASVFIVDTLPTAQREIARAAYYSALRNVWITGVALAAAGLISCVFIKGKELSKVHQKVETGLASEEKKARERKELAEAKNREEKVVA